MSSALIILVKDSPNIGSSSSSTLIHPLCLESDSETVSQTNNSPPTERDNASDHNLSKSEQHAPVEPSLEQEQEQPHGSTKGDEAQVQAEEEQEILEKIEKIGQCLNDLGFTAPRQISYLASGASNDVYRIKFGKPKHPRLRRNKQCHHTLSQDVVIRMRRDAKWKGLTLDAHDNPVPGFVDKKLKDGVAIAMVLHQKGIGPVVYFFDATADNKLGQSFMISRYWKGTNAMDIFKSDDDPGSIDDKPAIQLQKGTIASTIDLLARAETISFDTAGRIHAAFECDKGCTLCIQRSTQQPLIQVVPLDAHITDRYHPDSATCLLTQIDNVLYSRLLESVRIKSPGDIPPLLALWSTLMDIQEMLPSDASTRTKQQRPVLVLPDAYPYNTIVSSSGSTVKRSIFIDPDEAVSASAILNAFLIEMKDDEDILEVTQCDDRDADSNLCQERCNFQPRKRHIPTTSDMDIINDNPWRPLQLEVARDIGKDSESSRLFCASLLRHLLVLYNRPFDFSETVDRVRKLHWHSGLIKSQWVKQRGPLHFRYVDLPSILPCCYSL